MPKPSLKTALAALAVAALACFVWRGTLGLSLYAWDTFPLIAASRIASVTDLADTLTHELMDGRFPGGHFYRPLVELSFACDHAVWGLDPRGYHLTDLLILVVSGVLCVRLATRVLGPGNARWAMLAGLVFVLHPVQFEILPLPPRRADALSVLFVLLAVGTDATRARWLAALACLCAIASKETGVIAAPLVFASACASAREPELAARLRSAWRASWPGFALLVPFLAARTFVLGGLGGGARASVASGVTELPRVIERYATLVLSPLPPNWFVRGGFALALAGVLVIALFVVVARARRDSSSSEAIEPHASAFAVLAWLALLVIVTAVSGTYRAWYALPFVAPFALLVALACAHRRASGKFITALTLGAVVVLALLQGWVSDRSMRWDELRASSGAARDLLVDFDSALTKARPGSTLEFNAFPSDAATTRHGVAINKLMIFAPYSLEAWAELKHPELKVRVASQGREVEPAHADEVLVLLAPREVKATHGALDED